MERIKKLSNGDVLISGELIRTDRDGMGLVLVPEIAWREALEKEITEKADRLLAINIELQRHALLPKED